MQDGPRGRAEVLEQLGLLDVTGQRQGGRPNRGARRAASGNWLTQSTPKHIRSIRAARPPARLPASLSPVGCRLCVEVHTSAWGCRGDGDSRHICRLTAALNLATHSTSNPSRADETEQAANSDAVAGSSAAQQGVSWVV